MRCTSKTRLNSALFAAFVALAASPPVLAIDAEAAQMLARQNSCFKCHSIDKKKDGPPYREVAAKYRGRADAQAKLYHHVTAGGLVKFADGTEDNHKIIQTKDVAEINNLIGWILSL